MDSLISRVKGKLEVLRLEKRYAKRTHRAAYRGGAEYRDGEYVRNNNTNTGKGATSSVREMRVGGGGDDIYAGYFWREGGDFV